MREVVFEPTLSGWRDAARRLVAEHVAPDEVVWSERQEAPDLFSGSEAVESAAPAPELRVPRAFVELAGEAAQGDDPERWRLLYRVLWRLAEGDHEIMSRAADADVLRLKKIAAKKGARSPKGLADGGAAPFVPDTSSLSVAAKAVQKCKGCDLYKNATQAVFGEGLAKAKLVLVGEQPGDQEDLQGRPFVGPAGAVLEKALAEIRLSREKIYVTNAVKHFKFEQRGKRRIHQRPNRTEQVACRRWLDAELAALRPRLVVCLGAVAATALLGPKATVGGLRGRPVPSDLADLVAVTVHPSSILRAPDEAARRLAYGGFRDDLRTAFSWLA